MNKKVLVGILAMMCICLYGCTDTIPLKFSGWCYQETTNKFTSGDGGCDLNYSGKYSYEYKGHINKLNYENGNWDDYTYRNTTSNLTMWTSWYVKPKNDLGNNSLWQLKTNLGAKNYSIQKCLNYSIDMIRLLVYNINKNYTYPICYINKTTQLTLAYLKGNLQIYEEGVWWDIE